MGGRVGAPPAGTATAPARRSNLTVPNVISGLRLASVPIFVTLFVRGNENAGVALFAVAAWSDFFDGYLARRLDQVTELGKLLDPFADRVFIVALAIALVARGLLHPLLAGAIFLRDALVLAAFPWWEKKGVGRIRVNFTGKSATAALLAGLTWLAWSETTYPLAELAAVPGTTFVVAGAVLYWVAAIMYAGEAKRRLQEGNGRTQ